MAKHLFFIKYGKANTVIKYADQMLRFTLSDTNENETIHEGSIGDFFSFEAQMLEKLKGIGFKGGYFNKNIAYVAVPTGTSLYEMRDIFDSFDKIGFSEIFTIYEHVALAHVLGAKYPNHSHFGILDIGSSKIDISLIKGANTIRNSSFKITKARFDRYLHHDALKALLSTSLLEDAKEVLGDVRLSGGLQVILTGGRARQLLTADDLSKQLDLINPIIVVENNDAVVAAGLEAISKTSNENNWIK